MNENSLLINEQISAYESCHLERFLNFYSKDIVVFKNGEKLLKNYESFIEYYKNSFTQNTGHKVEVLNRISFKSHVIDHEKITGRVDGLDLQAIVNYKIISGKIVRVDFIM